MKRKWLYTIAGGMFIVGIGLLGYQPFYNYFVIPNQLESSYQNDYDKMTSEDIRYNLEAAKQNKEAFDYDNVKSITELDFKEVKNELTKENIIGLIYIPDVDIKLPILYGTNQKTMMLGAGTLKLDMKMGEKNYVLGSHSLRNKDLLFTPTRKMKEGQLIYLTDKEYVYTYKTTSKSVVKPSETYVMDDTNDVKEVTLISCYDDEGKTRLVVKGLLENKISLEKIDSKLKSQLKFDSN
ncbi:class A sortase [Bacillus paramycoides]|uniref:class A sortase n=1 Tax=Bacillus paramycoides TaxID=2026194 RepID=UPI0015BA00FE|nr:class A sortase [Bacillus paramycoides]NWK72631.1 class A sortase [Bacillus paramycoides]